MRLGLSELLDELFFLIGPAKEPAKKALEGVTQAGRPRVWVRHAGA
jgi:hypothetical protein